MLPAGAEMVFDYEERVTRVVSEMLEARGYGEITKEGVWITALDQKRGKVLCMSTGSRGTKLCTADIMEFVRTLNRREANYGILIFQEATLSCIQVAAQQREPYIEMINRTHVTVNPTLHRLVPRHELLSAEEVASLLRKGIAKIQLPVLLHSDPISRFYDFPQGSIVRIHRSELSDGCSDLNAYRTVR